MALPCSFALHAPADMRHAIDEPPVAQAVTGFLNVLPVSLPTAEIAELQAGTQAWRTRAKVDRDRDIGVAAFCDTGIVGQVARAGLADRRLRCHGGQVIAGVEPFGEGTDDERPCDGEGRR